MFLKEDNYPPEFLEKIKDLGKCLTPVPEIACSLDIPEDDLELVIQQVGNPIRKAYISGMAETNRELRRTAIESATAGSPAAMEQCLKFALSINI